MREYIQSSPLAYFAVVSGIMFVATLFTTLIMTIKPLRKAVKMNTTDYLILLVWVVIFGTLTWVLVKQTI